MYLQEISTLCIDDTHRRFTEASSSVLCLLFRDVLAFDVPAVQVVVFLLAFDVPAVQVVVFLLTLDCSDGEVKGSAWIQTHKHILNTDKISGHMSGNRNSINSHTTQVSQLQYRYYINYCIHYSLIIHILNIKLGGVTYLVC